MWPILKYSTGALPKTFSLQETKTSGPPSKKIKFENDSNGKAEAVEEEEGDEGDDNEEAENEESDEEESNEEDDEGNFYWLLIFW